MLGSVNDKGYTLIELLVSVVIAMILMVSVSATYVAQNRSFTAQESVAELNSQSKTSHNLIAATIREAGFVLDFTHPDSPAAINGFSNIITPLDGGGAGSDAITIITANNIGQLWPTGIGPGIITCGPYIGVQDTSFVDIIVLPGADAPNAAERSNLILDIDYAQVVAASAFGFGVTLSKSISHRYPLLDTFNDTFCDTGRPVYLLEDITFCLDGSSNLRKIRFGAVPGACASGLPGSVNEIIAENIDDLQFAYATGDLNGNGILDDGDFIDGNLIADFSGIMAVRINILARSDRTSDNYTGMGNPPAVIENRANAQPGDAFKRRWLRSIIVKRN